MNSTGASEGASRRLVSNSRWNLLAFAVSLLVNFATIPIVITAIGLPAFGAGGLVLAVYAPLMLVGTVLGQAMVKELAPLLAAGPEQHGNAASMFSTSLFLCVSGSILLAACTTLLANVAVNALDADTASAVDWQLAFLVAACGWGAQQVALVLQAGIAATQRFAALAQVGIVVALSSAACVVAGAMWRPDHLGFLLGTSAGFLLALALWWRLVRRELPFLFPLARVNRKDIRLIMAFGKWQGGAHFVGATGNQIDRYLLGVLAPLSVVGQFNVAMRLQEVVHMGLLKATEVLLPHFAVTATDSLERRGSFFAQASWVLNLLGACALAPLVPLAHSLIALWINEEAAQGGAQMLRTLAAAGILGCGVNVYYYFALGTGQQARMAILTTIHALLTIAFTGIALLTFGPMAAGAGYLAANLVRLAASLWLTRQHFSIALALSRLLQSTLPPLVLGLAVAFALWHVGWFAPDTWWALLRDYALIATMVALSASLVACASRPGRDLVIQCVLVLRQILLRRG